MIICVCQSVSDREVRAAIRNGVTSLEQLQLELGVASGCGKCTNAVCEMLIQTRRCTGKKKHTRAPAKPPRAFFIGLHSVTSRSPYYLYCLHARSLCNLTEKGSRASFAFIIFPRTRESPSFRPHPVRRRGDARKRQPS